MRLWPRSLFGRLALLLLLVICISQATAIYLFRQDRAALLARQFGDTKIVQVKSLRAALASADPKMHRRDAGAFRRGLPGAYRARRRATRDGRTTAGTRTGRARATPAGGTGSGNRDSRAARAEAALDQAAGGRPWVVETDIASCFSRDSASEVDASGGGTRLRPAGPEAAARDAARGGDGGRAGPASGHRHRAGRGDSPVMCNVYLHRLDRAWDDADGVLARFADDLVVMCWSRSQAEQALQRLTDLLADLGLEPKAAKTRIVHLEEGGEGFDFLGFHHRLVRSRGLGGKKPVTFLARWPSDRAMQHARDRIRELTGRRRLLLWPELIAEDLNRFLRGWAAYFRYGHSAQRLSTIRQYARMRLALFISKRHRRSRNFGWRIMLISSPGDLGLVSLYGITVAPRAGKPWREKPNAGGERRR